MDPCAHVYGSGSVLLMARAVHHALRQHPSAPVCRAIVAASRAPMSIIIVGIGQEDFISMEMLDSDDRALKDSAGNEAVRDIVQFVPFRDFCMNGPGLAQAVLAELPGQVSEFMRYAQLSLYCHSHMGTRTCCVYLQVHCFSFV
jgi:hypothetical protein